MGTSTHSQDTKRGYAGPYLAIIARLLDNKGDEVNDGDIILAENIEKKFRDHLVPKRFVLFIRGNHWISTGVW